MRHDAKLKLLRRWIERTGPADILETLAEGRGTLEGVSTEEEETDTSRGLRKVARKEELTPDEAWALEAIVLPEGRPVIDIVGNTFDAPHGQWSVFGEQPARRRLEAALPSIGRVELPDHPAPYGGTGFIVGPNLVMTNRHVAQLFTSGVGVKVLKFLPGQSSEVDFFKENGSQESFVAGIRSVAMIHPYWDMALLRLDDLPDDRVPLTLSTTHPADLARQDIGVVGYPAFDSRNDAKLQNKIFRGVFNVKRLQPGRVGTIERIQSFGNAVGAVTHDASTLGGNSGSAVVHVSDGQVLALHFAGRYLENNYAVPTAELARDARVVDAGVQFAGALPATTEWDSLWRAADPDDEGAVKISIGPGQSPPVRSTDTDFSSVITVPLQIELRVGTPVGPGILMTSPGAAVEATDLRIEPDSNYGGRPGYRDDFLGSDFAIRIPWLSSDQYADVSFNRLANNSRHVLPYHNFSVVMSRSRRLAFFTAANIDGRQEISINRGRFNDRWFIDPRIPAEHQLDNDIYAGNPLDRGHLVRRLDPTWAPDFGRAKLAHDDTFHWTNCSPQHMGFNRNQTTWGGVENYILHNANNRDLKVTVFTGPVFRKDDPIYHFRNGQSEQLPLDFWKVVAMVTPEGQLSATAYLISQSREIDRFLAEEFVFGAYGEFQTTVADIEAETGLSFHQLRDHDPLVDEGTEALEATGSRVRIPLVTFESVRT